MWPRSVSRPGTHGCQRRACTKASPSLRRAGSGCRSRLSSHGTVLLQGIIGVWKPAEVDHTTAFGVPFSRRNSVRAAALKGVNDFRFR